MPPETWNVTGQYRGAARKSGRVTYPGVDGLEAILRSVSVQVGVVWC